MNVKKYYKQVMIALGCGLLFCGLLAVDLGSKALAEWYHEAHGLAQSEYFLGFIRLTYAQNYDVAYGIIGQIFEVIGKDAVFPASQKWREEAKREDAAREARERAKKDATEQHD